MRIPTAALGLLILLAGCGESSPPEKSEFDQVKELIAGKGPTQAFRLVAKHELGDSIRYPAAVVKMGKRYAVIAEFNELESGNPFAARTAIQEKMIDAYQMFFLKGLGLPPIAYVSLSGYDEKGENASPLYATSVGHAAGEKTDWRTVSGIDTPWRVEVDPAAQAVP